MFNVFINIENGNQNIIQIPSYPTQNGNYEENIVQQMLVRM
jgi:hypothetical protein